MEPVPGRASIIALPTLVNYIESSLYNSPVPGTLKIVIVFGRVPSAR
jgi:hypothetical protein